MPQRLMLGDGTEHIVGEPVEDPAPEQVADAQAALEDGTAEPAITPCVTAFTVYIMKDGDVLVGFEPWADPQPERGPTFDEMTFGASVVRWHAENYSYRIPGDTTEGCLTAFTPYITHDGRWLISADPSDPIVPDRQPTDDEVVGGLAVVQRDVHTQEILGPVFNQFAQALVQSITQSVIGNMVNLGKQAQEAQAAMQVAEQIEKDKQRRAGGR